jgi:lysozyme family protein
VSIFDEAFEHTVGIEGKYSNNAADSGGETMYGITIKVARANGYHGSMRELPLAKAKQIYREDYWDVLRLDDVATFMPALARELFDAAVNCGTGNAGRWLQAALNALNSRGTLYSDIAVDGQVGKQTLAALDQLRKKRSALKAEIALGRLCDAQQAVYYLELSQRRQKDEEFVYGWVMNRIGSEGW